MYYALNVYSNPTSIQRINARDMLDSENQKHCFWWYKYAEWYLHGDKLRGWDNNNVNYEYYVISPNYTWEENYLCKIKHI